MPDILLCAMQAIVPTIISLRDKHMSYRFTLRTAYAAQLPMGQSAFINASVSQGKMR